MDSLKKSLIWFFMILLCGLPFSFLAFGSDIQTQHNPLYPYRSSMMLQEDFITGSTGSGAIGSLGWISVGTISVLASEVNRPGIARVDTGSVLGSIGRISYANSSAFDQGVNSDILWVARLNTNDANTTVRIGSANSVALSPPNNGIYFEKLDADTNWFCVTRGSAVQTRTDTGVAVNTSFNTFRMVKNSSGVQFILNNTNVCTHTTNLPANLIAAYVFITNSAAAAKTVDVDYFQHILTGMTR